MVAQQVLLLEVLSSITVCSCTICLISQNRTLFCLVTFDSSEVVIPTRSASVSAAPANVRLEPKPRAGSMLAKPSQSRHSSWLRLVMCKARLGSNAPARARL
jgi:hypothetical protein